MLLSLSKHIRLIAVVLLLTCALTAQAQPSEKQQMLQACAREFGSPIDRVQQFFEIDQMFVLQLNFNRSGLLTEFVVKPKYFFNGYHPEWKEPDDVPLISWADFKQLLTRLDALKPKGRLTKRANDVAVITNGTGYFRENYERASLEWGESDVDRRGQPGSGVRFFTLRYLPHAT